MHNAGRLVVFLFVLGKGVERAFLKECVAAFLRFPRHVVLTGFGMGVVMGLMDIVAQQIVTQYNFKGALDCTTLADLWHFFLSWARRGGGVFEGVCGGIYLVSTPRCQQEFGRGVVMGFKDFVAKKILAQLNIKGALGCTTLAEW